MKKYDYFKVTLQPDTYLAKEYSIVAEHINKVLRQYGLQELLYRFLNAHREGLPVHFYLKLGDFSIKIENAYKPCQDNRR